MHTIVSQCHRSVPCVTRITQHQTSSLRPQTSDFRPHPSSLRLHPSDKSVILSIFLCLKYRVQKQHILRFLQRRKFWTLINKYSIMFKYHIYEANRQGAALIKVTIEPRSSLKPFPIINSLRTKAFFRQIHG